MSRRSLRPAASNAGDTRFLPMQPLSFSESRLIRHSATSQGAPSASPGPTWTPSRARSSAPKSTMDVVERVVDAPKFDVGDDSVEAGICDMLSVPSSSFAATGDFASAAPNRTARCLPPSPSSSRPGGGRSVGDSESPGGGRSLGLCVFTFLGFLASRPRGPSPGSTWSASEIGRDLDLPGKSPPPSPGGCTFLRTFLCSFLSTVMISRVFFFQSSSSLTFDWSAFTSL
mmetsp:Transcript_24983/g.65893  ORF Transcript_24983/g.65893 Transcript_24983/m.65893 type:complete len:229 (-) Transcript_24983:284-970(-)